MRRHSRGPHPPACTCVSCDLRRRSGRPRSTPLDIENVRSRPAPPSSRPRRAASQRPPSGLAVAVLLVMLAAAIGAVVFVAMWWSAVSGEEIEQLVEDISLAFDEEDKAMKAAYKDPSPENQLDMESAERRREGLQTRLLAKCRQYLDGGAKDKLDSQKEEVEEMETEIWGTNCLPGNYLTTR